MLENPPFPLIVSVFLDNNKVFEIFNCDLMKHKLDSIFCLKLPSK